LKYLEANPNQFSFVESRIASYTTDAEQSRPVVEVLQAQLQHTTQEYLIRKLRADLYLRVEDYANAIQEFKILEGLKDPLEALNKESGKEIFFFAEKALNAGQFQYALEAYNLILLKYKNSPFTIRALYGMALAKQKQKRSTEAIQDYNELIAQAPQSPWTPEALFQIGEIYFLDFFELDHALAAYQSLIQKYPQGPKTLGAYFRIGDCFAAKGDMKSAKLWYEKPMQLNSSNSEIRDQSLYKSAFVDFLNGEFDPALKKLRQVTQHIGQNPDGDQSFVNDALELTILIEENHRKSAEALQDYAEAQKFNLQRKTAEALAKLQAILANYPTAPIVDESLLELGDLENRRGNFAAAIDYFQNLLKDHPESIYNALAQKRVGEIYEIGLGDPRKAYEAYEQVLIHYPNSLYLEEVRQKLRALQGRQLNN
jgi:TolA-binding protein